jgi:predicted enzyme related to lactoylglutathione lyase
MPEAETRGSRRSGLAYVTVADLDESVARFQSLGGKILRPPQSMGPQGRFCVVQDPAGAVAALYESKESTE